MRALILGMASCVVLIAAAACRSGTEPGWKAAIASARWNERRPAAYAYTVRRSCECSPESIGPVIVSVENGVVTRRYAATNNDVPASYAEIFPTIDGLFEIIAEARRQDVARLDVDYDPAYGFPTRVSIDYHARMVDDEIVYRASDFVIPVR